jgi:hypothetical protein
MARRVPRFTDSVFINCPFDEQYWPLFEAIVFCILDCGFTPRRALEDSDSSQVRLTKICSLVRGSRYGIHDLSRIELSDGAALPRFNMPFELGLDLGSKTYGAPKLHRKKLMVLDSQPYRYQASISDLAGHDIRAHHDSPDQAIVEVRHWLVTTSARTKIPPASTIREHFLHFTSALPLLCDKTGVDRDDLQFVEYVALAEAWLTTPAA